MSDRPLPPLCPATPDEVAFAISHALRHRGKKQFHYSGEIMAQITTDHLVESLRQGGFVIMKQPPKEPAQSTYRGDEPGYKTHLTE